MSGNITFSRTVTGFDAGQGVTSPTACTTPGYEVELSMGGKREYTAEEFQFLADIIKAGETTQVHPDIARIVEDALRIASAVMRPGVIEDLLTRDAKMHARNRGDFWDDPKLHAAAIRKALLGEAEDAGR